MDENGEWNGKWNDGVLEEVFDDCLEDDNLESLTCSYLVGDWTALY